MKKSHLFIFIVFFLVSFVGCGSDSGKDEIDTSLSDQEIKEMAKKATVRISASGYSLDSNGSHHENWWGSGFFISKEGYIVTNNHVVTGAGELKVWVNGESKPYNAEVVGVAECHDLAVIKVTKGNEFSSLDWYEKSLNQGLAVVAAGFPGDIYSLVGEPMFSITNGIINTTAYREDTYWVSVEAVIHSALIRPGCSGGPLLETSTGKIAGINFAGTQDRNLAITNEEAQQLVATMQQGRNIKSIGATIEVIYDSKDDPRGVFVKAVQSGGKAHDIGIQPGDLIVELASIPLVITEQETQETLKEKKSLAKYASILETNDPEVDEIKIKIVRGDEICTGEINGVDKLSCEDIPGNQTQIRGTLTSNDYVFSSDRTYYDIYRFTALSSGIANIRMESSNLDSYLMVIDNQGNGVAQDDDSGGGNNALVSFTVNQGRQYAVVANEANVATGSYTITFSNNLANIHQE